MHCARVKLPDGVVAIICGSRRDVRACAHCGMLAGIQCDWKVAPGGTCDRWICGDHALEVGPNKHLCPEHQAAFTLWQFARAVTGPRAQGGA